MFIGLNPSTADETQDDPTIRRCVAFAKAWGYGGLTMGNIFAYRATKPDDMVNQGRERAVGPDNDQALLDGAEAAGIVVCAWGNWGRWFQRQDEVVQMMRAANRPLYYLKLTGDGSPGHPLRLKSSLKPQLWAASMPICAR